MTNKGIQMNRFFSKPAFLALFLLILIIGACRNPMGVQPLDETPTRGNIRISVDE